MRLPAIRLEARPSAGRVQTRRRRAPCPPRMCAMLVVVVLELDECPFEISSGPEQPAIQTFPPYCPNQPFDDRMGARRVWHRLDFLNVEDP